MVLQTVFILGFVTNKYKTTLFVKEKFYFKKVDDINCFNIVLILFKFVNNIIFKLF